MRRYRELGESYAGAAPTEARFRLLLARVFWPFAFRLYSEDADSAAHAAGREAIALARDLGRRDLECAALDGIGSISFIRGHHGRTRDSIAARIEIAQTLSDPWEIGDAFQVAADNALLVGDYRAAAEYGKHGSLRAREGPVWGACLGWYGIAKFRLGDWDGMFAALGEADEVLDPEDDYWFVTLISFCALARELRGERVEAGQLLDRIDVRPDKPNAGRAAGNVARVMALRRETERAWSLLVEYPRVSGVIKSGLLEAECDLVAITEDWRRAADVVARARAEAEEAQLIALPLYADRLEGRAAVASGRFPEAIDALTRASDGFASVGARWDAATCDLSLAEALAASGDIASARAGLEAATSVFEELRSVRELERARALLGRL